MDIQAILDDVPDYKAFLTVDEMDASSRRLAAEHPGVVDLSVAGHSRDGSEILCIKMGTGPKNALVFGCPHPNEPIGAMMVEYLVGRLAGDPELLAELGYTWYFIKCVDPDGTRLNEHWFKGPFTPSHYTRNFFRPAAYQQVEWTFPIDYKNLHFHDPMPETEALMKLMEEKKPDFLYSLHNAGFGGVYYYISHEAPDLYGPFHELAKNEKLPLNLGEPEVPYAIQFHPAIFKGLGVAASYDYLEKYTDSDPADAISGGAGSSDYMHRFADTFGLVCEMPYFYDARVYDESPAGKSRREVVLEGILAQREHQGRADAIFQRARPLLRLNTPFQKTVDNFLGMGRSGSPAKEAWAKTNPELEREAKVAEAFDNHVVGRFYRTLTLGMMVRMLEAELKDAQEAGRKGNAERGGDAPELESILKDATDFREESLAQLEADLDYSAIPIRKLVRVQLGAGLLTAVHVRDRE